MQTSDGKTITELPDFYGNGNWSYWDMRAVAYWDINGDGHKDIVILQAEASGPQPVFNAPAADAKPAPSVPARSVLDPFSVYEKGEALLRQELRAMSAWLPASRRGITSRYCHDAIVHCGHHLVNIVVD